MRNVKDVFVLSLGGRRTANATILALLLGAGVVFAASGGDPDPKPERIAFDSDRDGDSNIFSMLPDGTDVIRVTDDPGDDVDPSWEPRRTGRPQRIAFASNRDGDFDLYSVEADGSDLRRLTANTTSDTGPAWSPDASRIAFASRRNGNTDIYVMRADGSAERRLTRSDVVDRAPAWSPDGSRLAFESGAGGTPHIWTMRRDGTDLRQVTAGARADSHPTWFEFGVTADPTTPADDLIAFDRLAAKGNYEVESVFASGASVANLSVSIGADTTPAWSSGGKRIAFASARDGRGDIYVMDASGAGQTRLTMNPSNEGNPDWSGAIVDERPARVPPRLRTGGGGRCGPKSGTSASETLEGDFHDDSICGYDGNDRIYGRGGKDKLIGMDGKDHLYGGDGDDKFWAKDGKRDWIYGGSGGDYVVEYDSGLDVVDSASRYK